MASIAFRNISKTYPNGVAAVSDFDLVVNDTEFVVLVGPSGCGKSTTLRMVAGLEEITEGELYIGDRLVNEALPKDRDIAMVFQNYALYPHMTVYRNMAFGLLMRRVPKDAIDVKVRAAAKILDIEYLLNRKPKELSGGQRQRVALGRAIVRDPAVFLLDEPLSNLDAKLRASMRAEITKLHKDLGATFVYVTHDQTEAMTMGDRIVVMKDGFIQQVDSPQNLYRRPANLFVAGFIGSPQMNFVDASIGLEGDGFFAAFGQSRVSIPESAMAAGICEKYLGKPVVLGIRPESISESPGRPEGHARLDGRVDLAELVGAEKYVYFTCEGSGFVAKVPGTSRLAETNNVTFTVDCDKIHLFDKETGQAVSGARNI